MNVHLRSAAIFYGITLAMALGLCLLVPTVGKAVMPLTMLTPGLGALAMLFVIAPEGTVKEVAAGIGLTQAGMKAWPFAIIGPMVPCIVGLILLVSLGYTTSAGLGGSASAGQIAANVFAAVIVGTALAACEEIGWRGYMLPRMASVGLAPAMLMVGFLHGVWHLPLMLTTDFYHSTGSPWVVVPLFLITLTLAGVFYGFLRAWSGSIWPVALAHSSVNLGWNISTELSNANSPIALEYIGGESGLVMIMVLAIADIALLKSLVRLNPTEGASK